MNCTVPYTKNEIICLNFTLNSWLIKLVTVCDQLTCAFLLVQGLKFIQLRKNIAQEIKQKCGENTPNHKVKEGK